MGAGSAREWTRDEVNAQLARVLRSPEFARNKTASRILTFVVEETLEGRGARLKAFTIGQEIFARGGIFDAQNNSIVRVQAARLRQLLDLYYAGAGAEDPIHIKMPLGAYRVTLDRREAPVAAPLQESSAAAPRPEGAAPSDEMNITRPAAPEGRRSDWRVTAVAALALAFASGVLVGRRGERPPPPAAAELTARPKLLVKLAVHPSAGAHYVERLADAVERALSAFDDIGVRMRSVANAGDASVSHLVVIDAAPSAAGGVTLAFNLVRVRNGALVWARTHANTPMTDDALEDIAARVSQAIGDIHGAVNMDMAALARSWPGAPSGYGCILASHDAIRDRTPAKIRRAVDCLEADLAADPDNAHEQSLLAAVLVERYLDAAPGAKGEDLRRAARLGRASHDRDPGRARAAYILFLTQFHDGRFEDAFAAARKAMEINPNAAFHAARICAAHIARGDYARGEKLLERMERLDQPPLGFLSAYLALAALMRGDDARFQRLAGATGMENGAIGLILRIVAAHQANDAPAAAQAAQMLKARFPGVAADIPAALHRHALAPEIVARLMAGLRTVEPAAAH